MQAVDQQVIAHAHRWLEAGERIWLATVVATWGSSPRPVGSLLTCNAAGHLVGSLSGGCVEDDLLEKLTTGQLAQENAQFFTYGGTPEESERLGLPCGGHLDIVVEPVQPNAESVAHFAHLDARVSARTSVERTVDLRAQRFSFADVDGYKPLAYDAANQVLRHTYGPRFQLFLIGAGTVSHYVAEMGQALDYHVTVCDPREDVLANFQVDGVSRVVDMPDDAVRSHANDPMTAILALTHDPRIDDMGLMEALKTDAFYIGAMGSDRTSAARRVRLKALDLSDAEIDRLHAPIGLRIGSKTPPEIAIAILAELTAVRYAKLDQVRAPVDAQHAAG